MWTLSLMALSLSGKGWGVEGFQAILRLKKFYLIWKPKTNLVWCSWWRLHASQPWGCISSPQNYSDMETENQHLITLKKHNFLIIITFSACSLHYSQPEYSVHTLHISRESWNGLYKTDHAGPLTLRVSSGNFILAPARRSNPVLAPEERFWRPFPFLN